MFFDGVTSALSHSQTATFLDGVTSVITLPNRDVPDGVTSVVTLPNRDVF